MPGIELVLGGTAKVFCVHDREKRQVRTPDDASRLLRSRGILQQELSSYAKFQTCGCCDNVFAALTDIPQLCHQCSGANLHRLGGPINDPIEGVL